MVPLLDERCRTLPNKEGDDRQTPLIEFPALYPNTKIAHVLPRVKLEAGEGSALDPNTAGRDVDRFGECAERNLESVERCLLEPLLRCAPTVTVRLFFWGGSTECLTKAFDDRVSNLTKLHTSR